VATDTGEESPRSEEGTVTVIPGSVWRGERSGLAALLYEGYARKAAALRVDRETALVILGEAFDLDRCLIAFCDGHPAGVVGLVEGRARALDFPFALLRGHFGLVRSALYVLLLGIRKLSRPPAHELVFEALAVSPPDRSRGIGTRLVEEVEAYARERGYRSVGLEVTDTNAPAIRLYRRLGYSVVRTRRYPFVDSRAGFAGNHYMRKSIVPCTETS
jgi:ribosomal protein S18 acetylase RimI-like enzyme